jgi:N utilization substance protein B
MSNNESNQELSYPISKTKSIKGSRHLVREKVLQILYAYYICETSLPDLIKHIFEREFNFEEVDNSVGENASGNNSNSENTPNAQKVYNDKVMHPEEVLELESDIQIIWTYDERTFAKSLIENVVNNKTYLDELIDSLVKNWDINRIAPIDRILIQMAVTEFLHFPEIPIKVSMDEVLDISKSFSTDKSSNFINGVLDTIHESLKAQDKINKRGRGLKEG